MTEETDMMLNSMKSIMFFCYLHCAVVLTVILAITLAVDSSGDNGGCGENEDKRSWGSETMTWQGQQHDGCEAMSLQQLGGDSEVSIPDIVRVSPLNL